MDGTDPRRRRVLAALGAGALYGIAGCTDDDESDDTGAPAANGSDGGSDELPENDTEEGNEGEGNAESSTVDWPTYRADVENTGHLPDASGPTDPEVAWTAETGGAIYASPTVVDGTVYVGSYDDTLYALEAASGDEEWTFDAGGDVFSSVTVEGAFAYVGGFGDAVLALSVGDGEEAERFATNGDVGSSPAIVDDTVYVGADDGTVYALGDNDWEVETGAEVVASPAVSDGRVFVGSFDGVFYALDAATGEELWSV
ncbi:outer membrane protein assembly factor BamB family protein, partial [Halalkalicoccus subterraneus]|uniref:outer membrane protein assembly factor BamB family protein n=1 Tax=Halalkalicoccus subterraneus TaxID=2675002 RepID=UPI0013CED7E8